MRDLDDDEAELYRAGAGDGVAARAGGGQAGGGDHQRCGGSSSAAVGGPGVAGGDGVGAGLPGCGADRRGGRGAPTPVVVADPSGYGPAAPVAGLTLRVKLTGWPAWHAPAGLDSAAAGAKLAPEETDGGPV